MGSRSTFLVDTFLANEAATLAFGAALAQAISGIEAPHALSIWLHGNLGAGKTTLCRGFLRELGHAGAVKSPTYTLVEPYELVSGQVYHFDFYRLKDPQELEFIGAHEYFAQGRVCLVEWPERGGDRIPPPDLVLELAMELAMENMGRRLTARALGACGEKILAALSAQAFTPAQK